MKRLNLIEIETRWGFRSFELYCGDITKMEEPVDLLAFSVLEGFYSSTDNSVVGALIKNHQFDLFDLVSNCEFDLRPIFGCWVSKEIPNAAYKRLLCAELLGEFDAEEIIENVFVMLSILEAKGITIKEFALPVFGVGRLELDFNEIVKPLLEYSLKYLQRSQFLERIRFVEIDELRAAQLDQAMNDVLGRVRTVQPKGKDIDDLRKKIRQQLENVRILLQGSALTAINDLSRILSDSDSQVLELNTASRKLLEVITSQMASNPNKPLHEKIEEIRKQARFSEWVPYYMHLIRIFGNSAVHGTDISKNPPIGRDDIEIGLICLSQVIDIWCKSLTEFHRKS